MATVCGYIEKIKFRNEENGYTVLTLVDEKNEYVLVGTFHLINEGEQMEATGSMVDHPMYGEQMAVESYEIKNPEDVISMERYLGSGAIKGIGASLATRIVKAFKANTFRIMEEEPERLAEVKGVSEKMARAISQQIEEKKEMRQAMMFLQDYGISMALAVKIYEKYGARLYRIVKENPYQMADDISGVGFKMADEIAQKSGIYGDSDFRMRSGISYALLQATLHGHTYLKKEMLLEQASDLLRVESSLIETHLVDMQMDKRVVIKPLKQDKLLQASQAIYSSLYYYMELNTAKMLHDLNVKGDDSTEKVFERLDQIQASEQIVLDETQKKAVFEAVNSGLFILTGGPGTGKTTTINTIIHYFEGLGMDILLAAPTGRAAKRMTETTGYEAKTIHRLLEISGIPREDGIGGMSFERNEENPLDADVVIIDEVSMVDIHLMYALLKAVVVGTRLILVGDVNQLPSVGPGNVLRDMIDSECFNTVKLLKIFRQAFQSDIVVNAHKINHGEVVPLDKQSRDFLFIKREDPNAIINAMITLVKDKLPGYVNVTPFEVQVMTPMRKGVLGVDRLNGILQTYLNPPDEKKVQKEYRNMIFREGDKVMQIKNNYQLEWEIRQGFTVEKGCGVYNGDIGIIQEISEFDASVTVLFDDSRFVEYGFEQLEELELAYAITIHKSQGSEYPAVVIPIHSGPKMLMSRNLIYTAVTRAKSCVCLVGISKMFQDMVDNEIEQKRYCGLKERILELQEVLEG